MSEFFEALERAAQDRLRTVPLVSEPDAAELSPPIEPTLAIVPLPPVEARAPEVPDHDGVDDHLVSLLTPTTFAAEQYRSLRHFVEHLRAESQISVIAVSSPGIGDGKTTTAINLAGALAQAPEARVLLLELDVRRPSFASHLALSRSSRAGIVDAILRPSLALKDVVRTLPTFNLAVVTAGEATSAPYEVLKSDRLQQLLAEARQEYDHVIVDTPPLAAVPDCRVISRVIDGFIIVVRAHGTPKRLLEAALTVTEPDKLIGLIYNNEDRPLSGNYTYGYGTYAQADDPSGRGGSTWGRTLERVRASAARARWFRASDDEIRG